MDDLIAKCVARIQTIIDQLRMDLDSLPDDADTATIREAIQKFEDTLHQYDKKPGAQQ